MNKYIVPVTFKVETKIVIEAENPSDAIEIASDLGIHNFLLLIFFITVLMKILLMKLRLN